VNVVVLSSFFLKLSKKIYWVGLGVGGCDKKSALAAAAAKALFFLNNQRQLYSFGVDSFLSYLFHFTTIPSAAGRLESTHGM
jgi:hypothetical protein